VVEHLYIHVPFCAGKCAYCGFFSVPCREDLALLWLEEIRREAAQRAQEGVRLRPVTVYIGGGTPTTLSAALLDRLAAWVRGSLCDRAPVEWTIECNPGSLTGERLDALLAHGVNRFSVGAQSMSDATLRRIGRPHSREDAERTFALLRAAGVRRAGLDLIAGLPGVTRREWRATLRAALRLEPDHVSVYTLERDGRAPWFRDGGRGPAAASERGLMAAAGDAARALRRAGFERYEISNYALPGARCEHNTAVWRGADYLGLGPAAASRIGLRRRRNARRATGWLGASGADAEDFLLTEAGDEAERFLFGFRMPEGVALPAGAEAGTAVWRHRLEALRGLRREGLARLSRGRWRLTQRGLWLADAAMERLLPG
jgi:oxygen-independent coproporphyrinogen-3 oxidase